MIGHKIKLWYSNTKVSVTSHFNKRFKNGNVDFAGNNAFDYYLGTFSEEKNFLVYRRFEKG